MENEKKNDNGHDKEVTLIVNTREETWREKEISFRQVVVLAYGTFETDPNVSYTVTYSRGPEDKVQGRLVDGQSVNVKDRMVFNVKRTNKS